MASWQVTDQGSKPPYVGAAHCVFAFVAAGHNEFFAVAITGVPFLLVGTPFLASWSLSRRTEAAHS